MNTKLLSRSERKRFKRAQRRWVRIDSKLSCATRRWAREFIRFIRFEHKRRAAVGHAMARGWTDKP